MSMKLDRRSFLVRVLGSSAALALSSRAIAHQSHFEPAPPPTTDSDSGEFADPTGNGRGRARTGVTRRYEITNSASGGSGGITDADTGPSADPAGTGRGAPRTFRNGITDGDSSANGSIIDEPEFGRTNPLAERQSGITDSDLGASADPAGNGRGND
ncbi:hypothetical protein HFP51_02615 [Parasphingopyxis sp. CP4]|uniref:hypothetical protein n=1 Tax=Parasphingopyxis sp. CP4 TaxID=2724527 RepID=UPI0015A2B8AF|nr:hypothetical protein [Parasphingopyxis sp. CP4]QLC21173.1 hypothetical protein HFP51_02615 [Parasphingopyxis sp. CP4]